MDIERIYAGTTDPEQVAYYGTWRYVHGAGFPIEVNAAIWRGVQAAVDSLRAHGCLVPASRPVGGES